MKITLHVDDSLLKRVMDSTGTESKTKAIDLALREMDRRAKLVSLATAGLGLSADELKESVDAAYNLEAMRKAETPVSYGRKRNSR
jgi:Arc/MetJ family transcription regulator